MDPSHPVGTLNFKSLASAILEIGGGSQNSELGHVTPLSTPYGLTLQSFH